MTTTTIHQQHQWLSFFTSPPQKDGVVDGHLDIMDSSY